MDGVVKKPSCASVHGVPAWSVLLASDSAPGLQVEQILGRPQVRRKLAQVAPHAGRDQKERGTGRWGMQA